MSSGNGAAAPKSTRSGYTYTFKAGVIDEYIAGGITAPELATKHNLKSEQLVYNWKNSEKVIRKRAKLEAKGASSEVTQVSRPVAKAPPDEVPALRIIGLTPLIRVLVQQEIKTLLGPIVREEMQKAFGGK